MFSKLEKFLKLVIYFLRKCAVKKKWSLSVTNSAQRVKDRYNSGQRLKDDKMENLYKVKYLLDGINNFEIYDYQRSQLILLQE